MSAEGRHRRLRAASTFPLTDIAAAAGYKWLQTASAGGHRWLSTVVIRHMKTIKSACSLALALALGMNSPAFAEYEHNYPHYPHGQAAPPAPTFQYQRPAPQYYPDYRQPAPHRHHERRDRDSDWVAPIALLAIAGLAVATLSQPARVAPPPPAPVLPPPVRPAAGNYWHYCPSSGQYYPNVRHCAAPWQLMPASY
jgi:hypothetical protein